MSKQSTETTKTDIVIYQCSQTLYNMCVHNSLLRRPERILDIIKTNSDFVEKNQALLAAMLTDEARTDATVSELSKKINDKLSEMTALLKSVSDFSQSLAETNNERQLIERIRSQPVYALENLFFQFYQLRTAISDTFAKLEKRLATTPQSHPSDQQATAPKSPVLFKKPSVESIPESQLSNETAKAFAASCVL